MSLAALYPANPAGIDASLTQPSPEFKKQVVKVMLSILLFFLVYIVLFILAMALAAASAYAGAMLIISAPGTITLFIGGGLIGFGLMVFFFLVKFMFAVSKADQSRSVEIKEKDQPELFAFIHQINRDTQTPFPKKIFISPEVNAMVFYNSSFWSMLFPVRKNLSMGLGLVNTLNLSELKAVIAHEFGHFSQRSMKLGSFVYNVNRIIYNMLFENSGYASVINRFAAISGIFKLFARVTVWIVRGIQAILQKMYGLINKNYYGLSRQMEFHADAVAASISGGNNLITALRRIDVAQECYHIVINKYNEWYKQNIVGGNVYPDHQWVILRYCNDRKLETDESQLPVVSDDFFRNNNYSRINFKDQWASHPALQDREAHLRGLNIPGQVRTEPAWTLFRNAAQLQEALTEKLYLGTEIKEDALRFQPAQFREKYMQERTHYSFPAIFNRFYDGRDITEFDVSTLARLTRPAAFSKEAFDNIFNEDNATLALRMAFIEADIQTVKSIHDGNIEVKSFDFDGEKFTRKEAEQVQHQLEGRLERMKKQQQEEDEKAFRFFYALALQQGVDENFKQGYVDLFERRKDDRVFYDESNAMLRAMDPLYAGQLTLQEVEGIVSDLKNNYEVRLKNNLRMLAREGAFAQNEDYTALLNRFLDSNYLYFANAKFFDNELGDVRRLIFEGSELLSEHRFRQTKVLMELQADLLPQ